MKNVEELKKRDREKMSALSDDRISESVREARELFDKAPGASDVEKLKWLIGGFDALLKAGIGAANDRRRELELRVMQLEERLADVDNLKYCGTYEQHREYQPGNFVTEAGSIWHCKVRTSAKPGESDCWTLAVKRGKDGR